MLRPLVALLLGSCAAPPDARQPDATDPSAPPPSEPTVPEEPFTTVPPDPSSGPVTVPVFGGTMLHPPGSDLVFVAAPDEDRVLALSPESSEIAWVVDLPTGSLPFRLAAHDEALFVTLRGQHSVARIDLETQDLVIVDAACLEPRGVEWDPLRDVLWVACAGGELGRFDADGAFLGTFQAGPDARDVVPLNDAVAVSHFRTAEVTFLDPYTGVLIASVVPPERDRGVGADRVVFVASTAWRMRASQDGESVALSHQFHQTTSIDLSDDVPQGGTYGEIGVDCDTIASSAFSELGPDGSTSSGLLEFAALPVDLAWHAWTAEWQVVSAGSEGLGAIPAGVDLGPCFVPESVGTCSEEAVAIAFDDDGRRILQGQSPFRLWVDEVEVPLGDLTPAPPDADTATAFDMFHTQTPSGLACASCHPEGQDDGHVWDFGPILGLRRTQNLAVGLAATAPYHWDGEFPAINQLLRDVMVARMGTEFPPTDLETDLLVAWLDGIAPVRSPQLATEATIARGLELFESAALGCTECHGGENFTSNVSSIVGTGGRFQPPGLRGVGSRGPWMHDGCATTLEERFSDPACGGSSHGGTVAPADIPALVGYLNTL